MIPADEIFPGVKYVAGVMQLADGLMLIHDLDTFLSPEEEETLHEAIQETSGTRDEPET
jgi:purine-binding chemotaxis protein CheW